jgi:hypothetical protein
MDLKRRNRLMAILIGIIAVGLYVASIYLNQGPR